MKAFGSARAEEPKVLEEVHVEWMDTRRPDDSYKYQCFDPGLLVVLLPGLVGFMTALAAVILAFKP